MLECKNKHRYYVTDGVVYFGTREIQGDMWSLFLKNYQDYLLQHYYPGNPRYQMGTVPCLEVRWQAIRKLRPRIILDVACGTCNGIVYDLQRINWPCLVILTDLSYRVLNKKVRRQTHLSICNIYLTIVQEYYSSNQSLYPSLKRLSRLIFKLSKGSLP